MLIQYDQTILDIYKWFELQNMCSGCKPRFTERYMYPVQFWIGLLVIQPFSKSYRAKLKTFHDERTFGVSTPLNFKQL